MSTVLHKSDDQFSIVTTAETEEEFREQFAKAIDEMIEAGRYDGDWAFQLEGWMRPAHEIVCKFRGYKSAVVERRTLIAGHIDPAAELVTIGREAELATRNGKAAVPA